MLLGYDVAIQALNHDLGFVSYMDNTVLAVVEADVFAYLGISVFVLREEDAKAAEAVAAITNAAKDITTTKAAAEEDAAIATNQKMKI